MRRKRKAKKLSNPMLAYYECFNVAIRNYSDTLNIIKTATSTQSLVYENLAKADKQFKHNSSAVYETYKNMLKHQHMVGMLNRIEEVRHFPEKYAELIQTGQTLEAAKLLVATYEQVTSSDLSRIGALTDISGRIVVEREKNIHQHMVLLFNNIIYSKSDNNADYLYVALEDDGKDGFTRVRKLEERQGHSNANENTRSEKPDLEETKELLSELVSTVWILDCLRPVTNELMSTVRSNLRQDLHQILLDEKPDTLPEDQKRDVYKFIFQKFFKNLKGYLLHHKTLCALIKKKVQDVQSHNSSALPSLWNSTVQDATSYTMEGIWDDFQEDIRSLVKAQITCAGGQNTTESSPGGSTAKIGETDTKSKLFSFSSSRAYVDYHQKESSSSYGDLQFGIMSSPYNISIVYPLIVKFNKSVAKTLSFVDISRTMGLKKWISELTQTTFLPFITKDYKRRITMATHIGVASDDFRTTSKESDNIMKSTLETYKCLQELSLHISTMPEHQERMNLIITDILETFIAAAQKKLQLSLQDTEVGHQLDLKEGDETLDPIFRALLAKEKTQAYYTGNDTSFGDDLLEEQNAFSNRERVTESPYYKGLRPGNLSLTIESLLLKADTSNASRMSSRDTGEAARGVVTFLANMHHNLVWLSKKLDALSSPPLSTSNPSMPPVIQQAIQETREKDDRDDKRPARQTITRARSQKVAHSVALGTPPVPRLFKHTRLGSAEERTRICGSLKSVFRKPSSDIDKLCRLCLAALRSELRLWTFWYLDHMRYASYVGDVGSDQFITDFNLCLRSTHETLLLYLPKWKVRSLFQSLPILCCDILMQSLPKIKEINKEGIQKITREIISLQQIFTFFMGASEPQFERVRNYYLLLGLDSIEELHRQLDKQLALKKQAPTTSHLFTATEWIELATFLSPGRTLPEEEKNKILSKFAVVDAVKPPAFHFSHSTTREK
eukprot:TRINITY_DN1362_c0_g1_i1.p1 TRINITY_DN1362_c0_g1~~TRINITY_DN1362_c0_g1_i1.p1  ORF type:complete len:955 (+),score=173.07 TRINITY_DN1362_c0_g1_i1:509-3373(+)